MLLLQVGDSTAWYGKCPGDGSVRAASQSKGRSVRQEVKLIWNFNPADPVLW